MKYTVTCNGQPWKVSVSHADCERFIGVQKRKIRGAGLCEENDTVDEKSKAAAAKCQWAIRPYRHGDDRALLAGSPS